ncbi:MAG: hypothetical protein L6R45_15395 [Anaerolineae bacterium]|nr:hypothetical protein [Anaerolineae bacterium]
MSHLKSIRFSPFQVSVLTLLTFVLCSICGGIGFVAIRLNVAASPPMVAALTPLPLTEAQPPSTPIPTSLPPTWTPSPIPSATAVAVPSATATYVVAPALINKKKIGQIVEFVELYRGLTLPTAVPIKFLTRRQLQEQWRETSFDVAALEAVQTQQEFYRALNLIEPEVDLVQAAFDSQTDILLGYYTPEEKAMVIIAESVNMFAEEEMTFAHEYVHALQDHHFDLQQVFNNNLSGDALLAARSLPEGDARLVEDLFTRQNIRQDQIDYNIYRYLFREHPKLEGVSPALGIFTYFPYTAGEYFVLYLFFQGGFSWELVNQAYRQLPTSSEQIMHPEKYLAGEAPIPVSVPDLAPALGGTWREIDRDVLGEAGFLVWLYDQTDEQTAITAAAGWDGDAYTLWVDGNDHRVLVVSSLWASEADALELRHAFITALKRRGLSGQPYPGQNALLWEDATGVTLLSRVGLRVGLIIAPDRASLDRVRLQFAGF